MKNQCIFIISACHSKGRNRLEWKSREDELYRTILFYKRHFPDLNIFIIDDTLVDHNLFSGGLKKLLVEYIEFGYKLNVLMLKRRSTDIIQYLPDLRKLSVKLGFKGFYAIFSGNYLGRTDKNISVFNSPTLVRFLIHDYDEGLDFLNDEAIYFYEGETYKSYDDYQFVTSEKTQIFNFKKNFIS